MKQESSETRVQIAPRGKAYSFLCELRSRGISICVDDEDFVIEPFSALSARGIKILTTYSAEIRDILPLMCDAERCAQLRREWDENLKRLTAECAQCAEEIDPWSDEFAARVREVFDRNLKCRAPPLG